MKEIPKKESLISSLTDLSQPIKKRAGNFLQFALAKFKADQVLLVIPLGSSEWTILSLDTKGYLKTSHNTSGNLQSIFKKASLIGSEGKTNIKNRELAKIFSGRTFAALPLPGGGKRVVAALGLSWKENRKIGKSEWKKITDLAGEDIFLVLGAVLATEAIARKNRSLIKMGNTKIDHYQMVAHDLKGPICEIFSNLDLLTYNPNLTDDDREVLDTALCGCDSLYSMVADLLDIHKMEGKKLTLCFESFDLCKLLDRKAEKMKALAARKGLSLVVVHDPILPPVKADKEIVERVLANLFSNAIAYSYPNRPVTIQTRAFPQERLVQVSVKDEGEGIPKSMRKKIFEKFGQSYRSGTRKRYSTGLGLTFCKLAVERHGGKIWVESKEGEGSVFYFTLPLEFSR